MAEAKKHAEWRAGPPTIRNKRAAEALLFRRPADASELAGAHDSHAEHKLVASAAFAQRSYIHRGSVEVGKERAQKGHRGSSLRG